MGKGMPKGFKAPTLDAAKVFASVVGEKVTAYLPVHSPCRRDCFWVWEYLIEHEEELLARGYKALTIGPHNFDGLFTLSLENNAFKCLLVLVKYYQKLKAQTQAGEAGTEERKDAGLGVEVDLVLLLAKALTVNRAPCRIICQLYDLLKAETKRKGPLGQGEKQVLLVAYCASLEPLADPTTTGSEPALAKKSRYQDSTAHPEHLQDDSAEELEENKADDKAKVTSMLDELLGDLE